MDLEDLEELDELEEFIKNAYTQLKLYEKIDEKTELICYTLDEIIKLEGSFLISNHLDNILNILSKKKHLKSNYIAFFTKTLELRIIYKLKKTVDGDIAIFNTFIYSKQK